MTTQTRTKRYLRTWENRIQRAAENEGIQLFKMPQFSSNLSFITVNSIISTEEIQFIVDRLIDTVLVSPGASKMQISSNSTSSSLPSSSIDPSAYGPHLKEQSKRSMAQKSRTSGCKLENGLIDLLLPDEDPMGIPECQPRSKRKNKQMPVYLDIIEAVDEQLLADEGDEGGEDEE